MPDFVFQNIVTEPGYHEIENLKAGRKYSVLAAAFNDEGPSELTQSSYLSLPAAPGQFKSVAIHSHEIAMSWESVTSATYYSLERNQREVFNGTDTFFRTAISRPGQSMYTMFQLKMIQG